MYAVWGPQDHGPTAKGTPPNFIQNRTGVWKKLTLDLQNVHLFAQYL